MTIIAVIKVFTTFSENEIEIFERKFLSPLSNSRSRSSTTIVINDGSAAKLRPRHVMSSSSQLSSIVASSTVSQVAVVSPVSSHHARVLRTSSKVGDTI